MITWLQKYVGKHYKWLFGGLLAVVIVAFVFTFGPTGGCGRRTPQFKERLFFGHNINSAPQMQPHLARAHLSWWMTNGWPPQDTGQTFQYALQRIAALEYADDLGIPAPAEIRLVEFIKSLPAFQNQKGEYNQGKYLHFKKTISGNERFNEAMVRRALEEDYRIEKVRRALAGPGCVLPGEAEKKALADETRWSAAAAALPYNSFDPEIRPDARELQAFYDANPNRYEESAKIKIAKLTFPNENYFGKVLEKRPEPTEAELLAYYNEHAGEFVKPPPDDLVGVASAELKEFETVKEEIRGKILAADAAPHALEAADAFAYDLYRNDIARYSPDFKALVREYKAVLKKDIIPFNKDTRIAETRLNTYVYEAALAMDPEDRYFSDPVQTPRGAVIVIFEDRLPPSIPKFQAVYNKVRKDYIEEEKRRLFIEHGEHVRGLLQETMDAGWTFKKAAENFRFLLRAEDPAPPSPPATLYEAAAEARKFIRDFKGEGGMSVQVFDDFSIKNPPRGIPREVFAQMRELKPGEISPMIFQESMGRFVYLKEKKEPESAGDYQFALEELAERRARFNGWGLIQEIAAREAARAEIAE